MNRSGWETIDELVNSDKIGVDDLLEAYVDANLKDGVDVITMVQDLRACARWLKQNKTY